MIVCSIGYYAVYGIMQIVTRLEIKGDEMGRMEMSRVGMTWYGMR